MSRPLDLRHREPEVRKARVKLVANGLNAIGLALLIGSVIAPFLDPSKRADPVHILLGVVLGAAFIVAAVGLLRYILPKEE